MEQGLPRKGKAGNCRSRENSTLRESRAYLIAARKGGGGAESYHPQKKSPVSQEPDDDMPRLSRRKGRGTTSSRKGHFTFS